MGGSEIPGGDGQRECDAGREEYWHPGGGVYYDRSVLMTITNNTVCVDVSKTVAWSIQIVAGSIQRCRVQQSERLPKFPIPATQFLVSACSVEQAYGCVFYTAFFKEIFLLKHSLINVPINLTTDLS